MVSGSRLAARVIVSFLFTEIGIDFGDLGIEDEEMKRTMYKWGGFVVRHLHGVISD